MKLFVLFASLSVAVLYLAVTSSSIFEVALLSSCALALAAVSMGYILHRPDIFMKKSSGKIAPISFIIFWPYFLLNWLILFVFSHIAKEEAISEISPGIYLGRRLFANEYDLLGSRNIVATLDVAAEFSEVAFIRDMAGYLYIPVLDACAPSVSSLVQAVDWLQQQMDQGGVYVHCALGHSRSATIIAALLLRVGIAASKEEAINLITKSRPKVKLNKDQLKVLAKFANL